MICCIAALIFVQAGSSLDGTWTGAANVTTVDGHVEKATGWLWLRSQGAQLLGGLGSTKDDLTTIKNGTPTESGCRFSFSMHGAVIPFELKLEDNHLVGTGTADMGGAKLTIALDLHHSTSVDTLFGTVATLDSKLFGAYNSRDLATVASMFARDLEFYHDKDGLTGYAKNMDSFKRHFADPTRMRRQLVDGSLEVYPVKNFGAIEVGVHHFFTTEPGGKEHLTATAKFLHVWKNDKGRWKIVRVVSYDHE